MGEKNFNFIFTNLELKFGSSCNTESRKQSYLWPIDSKKFSLTSINLTHPVHIKYNVLGKNTTVLLHKMLF